MATSVFVKLAGLEKGVVLILTTVSVNLAKMEEAAL